MTSFSSETVVAINDFSEMLLKHTTLRLNPDYLDEFRRHVDPVTYSANDTVFTQGEFGDFALLVAEGEVELYDIDTDQTISVAGPGSLVGELDLIGDEPRAASARALGPVRGWVIDRMDYARFLDDRPELETLFFRKIYAQLSASHAKLKQQFSALEDADRRYHALAFMFVTIVLMVNCYALVNGLILEGLRDTHKEAMVFWTARVMELWGGFILWGLTKRCGLDRHDMGIRTENLLPSIAMGVAISIPALAAMAYFRTSLYPSLEGTPIIDINLMALDTYTYSLVSALQEWICRGVFLTSIASLMPGRSRPVAAIAISSLVFSTLHLHYSTSLAVVALVTGIVWGWLFLKYRNLAGPIISHFILGNAATLMGLWAIWKAG